MKKVILLHFLDISKKLLYMLILQILSLGVLSANEGNAQIKSIDEVRLKLSLTEREVVDVFEEIEKLTDFSFVYSKKELKTMPLISVSTQTTVYDLLVDVSLQTNLNFRQVNENIVVKKEDMPQEAEPRVIQEAFVEIQGVVLDAAGEPLPGVTVIVEGTTTGTVTDIDGRFTVEASQGDYLVFSFVGFESERVLVENQSEINITLEEDAQALEEVVVVAYGTQKKVNLTGSIASVKTDDIVDIPMSNLSNGLAGRAPGVQIVGTSGLAGASSSVRIRGSVGEPLYVINGIISDKRSFDALNPSEVDNISFLKDAASAAVYGSTAGNGVVLVTTKSGIIQKPVLEYRGNYSSSNPTRPLETYSAQGEIRYLNDTDVTKGLEPRYGQDILDYFADKSYNMSDLIWQTPTVQEHNLSLRGGTEDVIYYFQLGYHGEKGSFKNLGYDRYNFRSDVTANVTKNLKLNLNLSGNQRNYSRWYWPYDGAEDFDVADFYRTNFNWTKLYPFYVDAEGNPTNDPNDYAVKTPGAFHLPDLILNEGGYRDTRYRTFDGILKMDLDLGDFVQGLSTSIQGSVTADQRNMKSFVVHNDFYLFQSAGTDNPFIPGPIDLTQTGSHNLSAGYENIQEDVRLVNSYQLNWFLNYNRSFGRHTVGGLLVYEQVGRNEKNLGGYAEDLLSSSIDQIYNASGDVERRGFGGYERESARASWIGRANYSYAQKYIAEFSFRYDGNYRFSPDNRWGFFPSGSIGWRISEEEFMKNLSLFDELKLRASYGTTGSDTQQNGDPIDPWQWSQVYTKSSGYVFGSSLSDGLVPGVVPNPNITWSTISMWDIGLEFGILNNRLIGEFDVWNKTESNILRPRVGSTPSTYGAGLPDVNYAQRSFNGFEISMDWRDQIGEFKYSVYGNMGYAKDQWEIYDEPESLTDGTYADNWRSRIGKPQDRVYGYVSNGIIRTQEQLDALPADFTQFGREPMLGVILFEDIRGANYSEGPDGKIDGNDATYLSDNGSPRINYGFGVRGEWKGFTINAHFQGVGAYDRMISTKNGGGVFQVGNRPYFGIWGNGEYWTPENPDAKYPRVLGGWMRAEYGGGPSSFWIRNGAYLRLKNISVGYTLPKAWFDEIGIERVQIYGNATNLFEISGLEEHDPEQKTLDSYPLMKTFTGGLTIQF